jgi:anion-transporting  ArsA/GET3 family ATPase
MVPEQRVENVTYRVWKMVPVGKGATYQVCKMVPQHRVKTERYQVCREVIEQKMKQVTYRTCRLVPQQEIRECQYTVLKPVVCEKVVTGCRIEAHRVPYTVTRKVPKIVHYEVPVQVLASCNCNGCVE